MRKDPDKDCHYALNLVRAAVAVGEDPAIAGFPLKVWRPLSPPCAGMLTRSSRHTGLSQFIRPRPATARMPLGRIRNGCVPPPLPRGAASPARHAGKGSGSVGGTL